MMLRVARDSDLAEVLAVERAAFGSSNEAHLVRDLLADPSARPAVSLLAFRAQRAIGHILFTAARLEPSASMSLSILAPLAVVPNAQRQGIGGKLIEHGLRILSNSGIDLVFVLGVCCSSSNGLPPSIRRWKTILSISSRELSSSS